MIDEKEIEWWCKEFPELPREDIVFVLEMYSEEELNNLKDD